MAEVSGRKDFSFFFYYLQVIPILHNKFPVNLPFGSVDYAQNRFARWQPSWIFDRNNFSYKLTQNFLLRFESTGLSVMEN